MSATTASRSGEDEAAAADKTATGETATERRRADLSDHRLVQDADPATATRRLRELAIWYRAFAERTANPAIWEARLRTAEELDAEAGRIEQRGCAARTPRNTGAQPSPTGPIDPSGPNGKAKS